MPALKYKTRGNTSPQGKPGVYFCCHPEDFKKYFESVSDEILEKQNCSVWYKDEDVGYDEEFFAALREMQLFVIPVTTEFLCTENEALGTEFKFALENNIPLLPLMMERKLESIFNNKCGERQFLDSVTEDETAISYDEKLGKFLENVLIGDELAEKIRAAFDAYVFLSYRKKDRKYAQELMKLIHKNEFCKDIAIWYDEFLVPGENFNDAIKAALEKSDLFVLAVTPNIVNETNYVMTTEYPMAKEIGKPIVPAEVLPTDKDELLKKYDGITNVANAYNAEELSKMLEESLEKIVFNNSAKSPEHDFFIGLAFLSGIDVEVNSERALDLITSAAEAGLDSAMKKLYEMYYCGISVKKDVEEAIKWQRCFVKKKEENYRKSLGKAEAKELIYGLYTLGENFESIKNYKEALVPYEQCRDLCDEAINRGEEDIVFLRELSFAHRKLGHVYKLIGDYDRSFNEHKIALESAKNIAESTGKGQDFIHLSGCCINIGEALEEQLDFAKAELFYRESLAAFLKVSGGEKSEAVSSGRQESHIYQKLGDLSKKQEKYDSAIRYYEKALVIREQLASEHKTDTNLLNISILHNKTGHVYKSKNDICEATDCYLKAYEIVMKLYEENPSVDVQRQLSVCCSHLGHINVKNNRFDLAEELFMDALDISKKLADMMNTAESYRDLRVSCGSLASMYEKQNDLKKMLQMRMFELDSAKKAADITNSHRDLMDLSSCYNSFADALKEAQKIEEALTQYENAYKIRCIVADHQRNAQTLYALHYSCDCMANTFLDLGCTEDAKKYYRKCIDVCEEISEMEKTVSNLDDLGTYYVNLASLESEETQIELLMKALTIYEELYDKDPGNIRFEENIYAIKKGIEDIDAKLKKSRQKGFFKKLFGKNG